MVSLASWRSNDSSLWPRLSVAQLSILQAWPSFGVISPVPQRRRLASQLLLSPTCWWREICRIRLERCLSFCLAFAFAFALQLRCAC